MIAYATWTRHKNDSLLLVLPEMFPEFKYQRSNLLHGRVLTVEKKPS